MRIRRIDIDNFRGIKHASWRLSANQSFVVLIGPGDSTKTTVLTAIQWALHDRVGLNVVDSDFYGGRIQADEPIRIRVAVEDLPDELLAMDAFGGFLAGMDESGDWSHDPVDDSQRCIIVELLVGDDLEPVWQAYRPPVEGLEEEPHLIRVRHRSQMAAYRIDDRVDAHLRWSRTSSLGKLTTNREDTRSALTMASRAAREAAAEAVTEDLKALANEVQSQVQAIGATEFSDLRPGLDFSLANTQGNLALFEGDVPLMNFGLGTRRLTGLAAQELANEGTAVLLVDEVEHGLEPHRLLHVLGHLRANGAFPQVFVTTHSPTALRHLEPEELVMVRSTDGITQFGRLDDPGSLRPLLKACPEAFLARRVVINEGKTEYGVVLALLDAWERGANPEPIPSAALGVQVIEGGGGTKSAAWAKELLGVGYDVVLFMDSDDQAANEMVPAVKALGGVVVQWAGGHSIETAVCRQLDVAGLNAFIQAGIEVSEDGAVAEQSFADCLVARGAPSASPGVDPLDVAGWAASGVDLVAAQAIVGRTAKEKSWFKRVDKGRRFGRFILETESLRAGPVQTTLEELQAVIFDRTKPLSEESGTPTGGPRPTAEPGGQGAPAERAAGRPSVPFEGPASAC